MNKIIAKSISWGGKTLTLETGRFAQAALAAVTARYGDTVVLATVCRGPEKPDLDYFPLSVEYQEKLYAGGIIKGSRWIKRENRPTDQAIISARFIDRAIRPLFPKEYLSEIQVTITVLSVDNENDPALLGMIATSAALTLSGIPWNGPLGAARISLEKTEGEQSVAPVFVLNPANDTLNDLPLDLVVVGHREDVVMIEAAGCEVPEDVFIKALEFGQEQMVPVIDFIEEFRQEAGTPGKALPKPKPANGMTDEDKKMAEEIASYVRKNFLSEKDSAEIIEENFTKDCIFELEEYFKEKVANKKLLAKIFYEELKNYVRTKILKEKSRLDGRKLDEVRPIDIEVGILPRTHGSAFFQRGKTHVLSVVTLGLPSLEQWLEGPEGEERKSYMHHYNMLPFSNGEVGRIAGPGRREIGHGALAEKALLPVIPKKDQFPYAIRVVSEVMSSSGSTSMGSTCGSTLALMDAGVPIKAPVSGVAMGLVTGDGGPVILTDIAYSEDANGDMDCKVAGTKTGITAVQMDIKTPGVSLPLLTEIIKKSKDARMVILEKMLAAIPASRPKVSLYAPKIAIIHIPPEKIGEVIGPGGKIIRSLISQTGASIDVEDDGSVVIGAETEEARDKAISAIEGLTKEITAGEVYEGKVTRLMAFGAFVEILPGREGLVHVSQMSTGFVQDPGKLVSIGQTVKVRVTEIDEMGRTNLSMLFGDDIKAAAPRPERREGQSFGGGRRFDGGNRGGFSPNRPPRPAGPFRPASRPPFFGPNRPSVAPDRLNQRKPMF
ncbi:MAG: polyribonucleotide nucleotidyltransferase [bacterium]|nr:polyribonucleotide nucleotidyltransferase [bacterium]